MRSTLAPGLHLCRAWLAPLALVLHSCGGAGDAVATGPSWIRLARGLSSATPSPGEEIALPGGRTLSLSSGEDQVRLTFEFKGSDWGRVSSQSFAAPLPVLTRSLTQDGTSAFRLSGERGDYEQAFHRDLRGARLPPQSFLVLAPSIFLNPGAERPPERLRLEVVVERGARDGDTQRFTSRRFAGEAIPLWPGERLERTQDLPARSALRFGLAFEPGLHPDLVRGRELLFRIALDGAVLFEEHCPYGEAASIQWRSIALPEEGRRGARLTFEVQGPFAHTGFLAPTIGPLEIGDYSGRPWLMRPRPNILLFLADTFRADNLAPYGGSGVAPYLDGLKQESLLFTHAWSSGTYTLPSHASLFTGLFPHQAGIVDSHSSLARELVTVADFLGELGYRTGAVTDSIYVSQTYGMDQGFQYFDENKGTLAETAERVRAFLDADDGRPVFLFVQTYQTHMTYEASDEARSAMGVELGPRSELVGLSQEFNGLQALSQRSDEQRSRMAAIAAELRGHYLATVRDLDRGFAALHRELVDRHFFVHGVLLFTSDHGEAFGEHDDILHGGEVYEEQLRVPLFLNGPGIEPRRVDHAASLVDVPRTLAALAGASPDPAWLGTSLLDLSRDRPVFAFQCNPNWESGSTLCVIEGKRKVIGPEDHDALGAERLKAAYDLEAESGERENLLGRADWPASLFERNAEALRAYLEPRSGLVQALVTPEELDSLQAMGYAGDDPEPPAKWRMRKGLDTWHCCRSCSSWPERDFVEQGAPPATGELCAECKARKDAGTCD